MVNVISASCYCMYICAVAKLSPLIPPAVDDIAVISPNLSCALCSGPGICHHSVILSSVSCAACHPLSQQSHLTSRHNPFPSLHCHCHVHLFRLSGATPTFLLRFSCFCRALFTLPLLRFDLFPLRFPFVSVTFPFRFRPVSLSFPFRFPYFPPTLLYSGIPSWHEAHVFNIKPMFPLHSPYVPITSPSGAIHITLTFPLPRLCLQLDKAFSLKARRPGRPGRPQSEPDPDELAEQQHQAYIMSMNQDEVEHNFEKMLVSRGEGWEDRTAPGWLGCG